MQRKKTFAEALGVTNKKGGEPKEGWKTPPRRDLERWELTIDRKGKKEIELVREIKGLIKGAGVPVVKSLKEVREGRVVASFSNEGEKESVRQALGEKREIRVGENAGINPKIKITGVEKGLTDEKILVGLFHENAELWDGGVYEDWMDGARVLFRRPFQSESVENVVVEIKGETFRRLIRKKRVTVSMMVYVVEEFSDLAVCYRCSKFGHTGARCTDGKCCNKCGGNHEVRECMERGEWDCPNCKKTGVARRDRQHSASDKRCPVYRRKLDQRVLNTNYNG